MPLAAGTRLGPYEIVAPIGAGGMGEVHRARDTKLGRDVAIKVLPEEFSQDKDRLSRFEREAKLLASLNHTNIATLYGLEESDGQQFLVMELVEGETLAERIQQGPIPVAEARALFGAIADAVEAAHDKGIVHRDLKPANVKIAPDGRVKVLDFGLAKAFSGDEPADTSSQSPTLTRDTALGAILGTAAYMSPEQARGKTVDRRTDVWAFGCCLYEALTGKSTFAGETVSDTISAILRGEPDWKALPDDTSVRELLELCFQKDANQRLRGLEHARITLKAGKAVMTEARPQAGLLRRIAPWLVAAAAALFAFWSVDNPAEDEDASPVRFGFQLPATQRLVTGFGRSLEFSSDGEQLVYGAVEGTSTYQLFLRSMDELEPISMPGTERGLGPFLSPDGRTLGFFTGGQLRKVSLSGSAPTVLAAPALGSGADWATDDNIYYSPSAASGIWRVPASGGEPELVLPLEEGEADLRWPEVLPGGEALLFSVLTASGTENVAAQSLHDDDRRTLIENASSPRYVASGHVVFARSGSISAVAFEPNELEVSGEPVVVVTDLAPTSEVPAIFAISDDGSLAYVPVGTQRVSEIVWVDRAGRATPMTDVQDDYWDPRLSPEGDRLAVAIMNDDGSWDVWTRDLERETMTRLTFGHYVRPIWSPDGTQITFGPGGGSANFAPRSTSADGSGEAVPLTTSQVITAPASWSPDGTLLVCRQLRNTGWDIVVLREGLDDPEIILGTEFNELHPVLSPDGRLLAYTSDETGRTEVYVQTFPEPSGKTSVSNDGGTEPLWSRDGTELFYRNGDKMMVAAVGTAPELTVSKPSLLFEGRFSMGPLRQTANYDVAPDGRFVMLREVVDGSSADIIVVLNWFSELERLVPVK